MGVTRSILDIDVRDAKFQRFLALYERYQHASKAIPQSINEGIKRQSEAASGFERGVAAMRAKSQLAQEVGAAEDKEGKLLHQADRSWTSIAHSTKAVASNIWNATTSLLKWTGVLSAVSGLVGVGGLFGINRMAAGVSSQRRTSMGLGMSPGEMQAFN